jgi:hypothetical protein
MLGTGPPSLFTYCEKIYEWVGICTCTVQRCEVYDIVLAIVQKCKDALYLYEGVRRTNWKLNIYAKIHVHCTLYSVQCICIKTKIQKAFIYPKSTREVHTDITDILVCAGRYTRRYGKQIYKDTAF